jgi:hypothetical protein
MGGSARRMPHPAPDWFGGAPAARVYIYVSNRRRRRPTFIAYNGELTINTSLLSAVLHE